MANVFENNVITTWGDSGRDWLQSLPQTTTALIQHWNLTQLLPVTNLSYNYVMTGYQGTTPIILKISCTQIDAQKEYTALTAYNGIGCIRLLDHHLTHHALLLEHALPGTSLVPLFPDNDDTAIAHTVQVIQLLHAAAVPTNSVLPTLAQWINDIYTPHADLPTYHIHKAQAIAQQLFATQTRNVVLHGDLHHENIILSDRGWLAIDPKGIIGDPAYDVCAFIRNPRLQELKSISLIVHRIQLFSEQLAIDPQRLKSWVYVQAVLEACWAMNAGQTDPNKALAAAEQASMLLN